MPRVTVLMPVRNARPWVASAVESILAQTMADLTLLCIDDGSTDDSADVLRKIASRDPRVRVEAGEHRGLAATLNLGLWLAETELVARMDADDTCHPTRLEKQLAVLESRPEVAAVGTWAEIVDRDGKPVLVNKVPADEDAIARRLLEKPALIHGTVMFRRDDVLVAGGYRAEAVPAEDHDLWLRLAERHRLANIAEPLYSYRMNDESITSQKASQLYIRRQWVIACAKARRAGEAEPAREVWESRHRRGGGGRRARAWALRARAAHRWGKRDAAGAAAALCGAFLLEPGATARGFLRALKKESA